MMSCSLKLFAYEWNMCVNIEFDKILLLMDKVMCFNVFALIDLRCPFSPSWPFKVHYKCMEMLMIG